MKSLLIHVILFSVFFYCGFECHKHIFNPSDKSPVSQTEVQQIPANQVVELTTAEEPKKEVVNEQKTSEANSKELSEKELANSIELILAEDHSVQVKFHSKHSSTEAVDQRLSSLKIETSSQFYAIQDELNAAVVTESKKRNGPLSEDELFSIQSTVLTNYLTNLTNRNALAHENEASEEAKNLEDQNKSIYNKDGVSDIDRKTASE